MKVLILLSTFNGHLFLPELLNSLYCQEEIVFEILVRDDGSIGMETLLSPREKI